MRGQGVEDPLRGVGQRPTAQITKKRLQAQEKVFTHPKKAFDLVGLVVVVEDGARESAVGSAVAVVEEESIEIDFS